MSNTSNSLITDHEGSTIRAGKSVTIAFIVIMVLFIIGGIVYLSKLTDVSEETTGTAEPVPIVNSTKSKGLSPTASSSPGHLLQRKYSVPKPPKGQLHSIPSEELVIPTPGSSQSEPDLPPGTVVF